MATDEREMTAEEIAIALGAKEPSVKKALEENNLQGKRDWNDRRRIVYPAGSLEKVRRWLETH